MVGSKQGFPSWIGVAAASVDFEGKVSSMSSSSSNPTDNHSGSSAAPPRSHSDVELSIGERAFSAAGAILVSAVIVNPLDVAKRVLDARYPFMRAVSKSESACPLGCHTNQYRGTLDVLDKVMLDILYMNGLYMKFVRTSNWISCTK